MGERWKDAADGFRILVVEDEFFIAEMLVEVLSEHGCQVHSVTNAQDALRHLMRGEPCDLLFTDINLPGSVDGEALARTARELRPGLPVIYATGSVTRMRDLDAVPGAAFIPKPYQPEAVCALVDIVAPLHG